MSMNRSQLSERTYLIDRVWNRLHRLASDLPKARMSSELHYRADRDAYRSHLPPGSADDHLLKALQRDGVVMTTAEVLGLSDVISAVGPLVEELLEIPTPPDLPATHLAADRMR